jgi:hypothetical protein
MPVERLINLGEINPQDKTISHVATRVISDIG